MKKTLKGFKKTRHFLERQKQRNVSDATIIDAITHGSHVQLDYDHRFVLGSLNVTVDLENLTLITVHPGDPGSKTRKVLSHAKANEIRLIIEESRALEAKKKELEEDEFLSYVKENAVKKI